MNPNAITPNRRYTSFSTQSLDYYLNLYITSKKIDLVPLETRRELLTYFTNKAALQKASMESTSGRSFIPLAQSQRILDEYEQHITIITQSLKN